MDKDKPNKNKDIGQDQDQEPELEHHKMPDNTILAELTQREWELIKGLRDQIIETYDSPTGEKIKHKKNVVSTEITLKHGDYEYKIKPKDSTVEKKDYKPNPDKKIFGKVNMAEYVAYDNPDLVFEFLHGNMNPIDKFNARQMLSIALKIANYLGIMGK